MELTRRYDEALAYAAELHRGQQRKGTGTPYLSHLLAASSLVCEAGGSEDEAIAGLLHDALEDQGHRTSFEEIAARFGGEAAASCAPAPTPKCNPSRRGGSASRPIWSISGTPTCRC